MASPRPGLAGALVPELRVESRYDDNIFQQPRGTSDVATLIRPGLTLDSRTETQLWELRARRSFISYASPQELTPYTDAASLGYDGRWSEASSLSFDARYTRSRDPLDLEPLAIPDRGDLSKKYVSLNAEGWRGDISGRFNHWNYQRADLSDGESRFWGVSAFPVRSPGGVWLVSYRSNDLEIGRRTVLTADVITAGWRRAHSARLKSELQVGAANVDYEDASSDQRKFAGLLDVTAYFRSQESPSKVHLRVGHDITTTAEVGLFGAWRMLGASARWERLLDVEGGIFRDPTVTERLTLGVEDTLGSGKILALHGSHGRTRPLRVRGTRAEVYRASATFTVPVLPWLNQQTQYDFVQQGGLDSGAGIDFRRSRVSVSLTAVLR